MRWEEVDLESLVENGFKAHIIFGTLFTHANEKALAG
jgi:hypothetical protein